MEATKSVLPTSSSYSSATAGGMHPMNSGEYQLAYEMERLNELRRQVAAQEERFATMQHQLEKLNSAGDSTVADAKASTIESLLKIKERELALALMRVAELTRQLEQLRQGRLDGILADNTTAHAKLLDLNPELLQGIVKPLKSAHQSSAIQRSTSAAADIVLHAWNKPSSANSNPTTDDANRFNSLPTSLSKPTTSAASEQSRRVTEDRQKASTDPAEISSRLTALDVISDTKRASAGRNDAQETVDVNENLITSGQGAPNSVPREKKSAETSPKPSSQSRSVSSAVSSSDRKPSSDSKLPVNSLSDQPSKKSDFSDGSTDAAASRGATRAWVSSSGYSRKLGSQAASRYQSITSRLYGDSWLSGLSGLGGKTSEPTDAAEPTNATEPKKPAESATADPASETSPVSVSSPISPNSSEEFPLTESPIEKTEGASSEHPGGSEEVKAGASGSGNGVRFVYSCSTSKSTVEDRSGGIDLSVDDDDFDDDEDDDEEEDSNTDGQTASARGKSRFGPPPRRSDSMLKRDMVRWRERLAASPPPRRAAHTSRRLEDCENRELDRDVGMAAATDSDTSEPGTPRSPESTKHVSFDPFTLSLNAALEGELDVLQSFFSQVVDKNESNEDGLTALHNAVCSGCQDVLEFLVHSGCDVNVADCDGWTPLHCAASSNNVEAIQLLIEHGAAVHAFTWDSERETPLDKCSPDSPGFDQCFRFIAEAMDMLGIANDGRVYATVSYEAASIDELSFTVGDQLTVIHKGDERETLWWWARHPDGTEGYVPQNLLALYPPTGWRQPVRKSLIETSC